MVALETYRKKRHFGLTPEPRGTRAKKSGNRFVIQKHAARRLHYDLRLELDGVMKSWTVTRGPSLVPSEKRLAVQVEDHPVEYNKFEGIIPKGEYGGGTVMIWDRGRWYPEGDPHEGLKKGHLSFRLDGEKLKGAWHLVRIRGRPGENKANWLLIKAHDEFASTPNDPDILEEMPNSVVTGRSIEEIAQGKGRVWHSNRSVKENVKAGATRGSAATPLKRTKTARSPRRAAPSRKTTESKKAKVKVKAKAKAKSKEPAARGAPLPDFVPPCLATLSDTAPDDPGWIHEIKFDGYRIQARLDHGDVELKTRKALDWTSKFPTIASAIAKLPAKQTKVVREKSVMPMKKVAAASAHASVVRGPPKKPASAPPCGVRLTHPDRVYWEDAGVTKQGLADYYVAVWDWIRPHVVGRPLALVRCPEGASAECFFQKHASAGMDRKRLHLVREPDGDEVITIDDLDGLISLVQAGVLEIHTRGTTADSLETCDRLVFDFDPGPGIAWTDMVGAAREVRRRLKDSDLISFLKTTGGKGLHVVVPIKPTPWDAAKSFARGIADAMTADDPSRYTATVKKSSREKRIFVDYLRNSREATAVAPYSTRARPGAPVSTPLSWEELGSQTSANRYTVLNLPQRLARLRKDPWADIGKLKQPLPAERAKRK